MRRKRIFIVLAACVLVGIGVVASWPQEREPEYNGKKLSQWLGAYSRGYSKGEDNKVYEQEHQAAANAVRHIGTNAVPSLLRWITYEEPWWTKRLYRVYEKLPGAFQGFAPRSWMFTPRLRAIIMRSNGRSGILILGADASGAVPDLCVLAQDPDRIKSRIAFELLDAIGDPAVPALNRLTDASNANVRTSAFNTLHSIRMRTALETLQKDYRLENRGKDTLNAEKSTRDF